MSEIENVRVIIRLRPLNKRELETSSLNVTQVDEQKQQITVKKPGSQSSDVPKTYRFDHILTEDSTQTDVYCQTARPVVDKVLQGYNGTVLAYGQTGTGKTYTMTGLRNKTDQRGIIPNTFAHVFSHISKAKEELTFLVHVTYLEIYNENVRDLLAENPKNAGNLEVREHSDFGVFVQNLSGYIVNTLEELERLMDIGDKNRAVGATDLNFASSRSHTIFTITIESNDKRVDGGKYITRGKLHLVDLAGSERQSKTHATGLRLKEATKINQSLSVLGNVISALVDGKSNHIPYRNSKLTRLLQDSLGGNSKTIMITTISPSEQDYEETISTLRYANRAKNIQNHTHINEQPKDTLLRSFQNEIEELRRQLETTSPDISSTTLSEPNTPKKKDRTKKSSKKKCLNELNEEELEKDKTTESGYSSFREQDAELSKTKIEQEKIRDKLQQLTNKIIVGGVNLLEKAQNQEFLLEVASSQLEQSVQLQKQLEETLQQREAERIDFEERYSTLQEEVAGKTKKLKKLAPLINAAKTELADLQQEHQREMEVILDTVRGLTREMQLAELIINTYIPKEYQAMIERYINWNEDIGEYQLKCVAYTGNNMRKRQLDTNISPEHKSPTPVTEYRQYMSSSRKTKRYSSVPRPARPH